MALNDVVSKNGHQKKTCIQRKIRLHSHNMVTILGSTVDIIEGTHISISWATRLSKWYATVIDFTGAASEVYIYRANTNTYNTKFALSADTGIGDSTQSELNSQFSSSSSLEQSVRQEYFPVYNNKQQWHHQHHSQLELYVFMCWIPCPKP